jgi:hypothetical protein
MVMVQELYALITQTPFCLPIDHGKNAIYVWAVDLNNPNAVPDAAPISRTEQATIDTTFTSRKNYYMSMVNIKRACFTAVNACINNAFKVSNDPTILGWHAGMTVMSILDQLSNNYGKPTPAMLKCNDNTFRCPYSVADPPNSSFDELKSAPRLPSLGGIHIPIANSSTMQFDSCSPQAYISGLSKSGTGCSPMLKLG